MNNVLTSYLRQNIERFAYKCTTVASYFSDECFVFEQKLCPPVSHVALVGYDEGSEAI